jgi:AcrR family transcriptional regulator
VTGSDAESDRSVPVPRSGPTATLSPGQRVRREAGPLTDKGHARKAAILRAARTVFERDGFLDARIADIVAEADVAQGTFYTYFDSKDAVFQAVASEVVDEMIAALRPDHHGAGGDATPYERTYGAMQRFVDSYRPHARMIALIEQVGTFTPELRRLRLRVREAFVDRAANGIRMLQRQGIADPAIDPVLTAEVLGAMVDHTCYVWLNLGRDFDEEALLHALTGVWTRAIGVTAPQP